MAVIGIIAEYNPFHNGHKRQIDRLRAAFRESYPEEEVTVVSLMSGNFVQRGDLAVLPKGYRAMAAIKGGADLVLELPYPYSGACAEVFAFAGVYLLDAIGVDYIAFGSESGDLSSLAKTAENLSSPAFDKALSLAIANNPDRPYAVLRDEVYESVFGLLPPRKANDILGVCYLQALNKLSSSVKPYAVKREGKETATASRAAYLADDKETLDYLVPKDSFSILDRLQAVSMDRLETAILSMFRLSSASQYDSIADMPVGLAPRLVASAKKSRTLSEFFENAATKMYTHSRIRRSTLSCLFGVRDEMLKVPPAFTRLLGANKRGRTFLSQVDFPVLTRAGQYRAFSEEVQKQVEFSDRADSLYALADENPPLHKPFIV